MSKPEERVESPTRNNEEWPLAPGFKDSWKRFKTDAISGAMTTFDRCKRAIPPKPLPAKMKDHKLDGPFRGFTECHLADDVLLIYKSIGKQSSYFECAGTLTLKAPKPGHWQNN
jgi:addiction module RelE/StbE family toxin